MNPTARKNIILIVASIAIFFEALDIAIMNLAMPLVQKDFTLPADTVQWLQTLYILLYGGFLIIGGKLADVVGRKRIFLLGSAIFLFTSLGAGLSSSFLPLLLFRGFQGLGAAFVMPAAFAIITATFTEKNERGKAIGIFSAFAAIGSGTGLSVGGIIAATFGWQWVFLMNVPIISLSILLAYIYIPQDSVEKKALPDILSSVLLTLIISVLSFVIHESARFYNNYIYLLPILIGIALMGWWFVKRNREQNYPLIDVILLRSVANAIVLFLFLGGFFTVYLFIISMFLQNNMGFSAAKSGLLLFPFSILSALTGKFLIPLLMKRFNMHEIARLAMLSMTLGALLLYMCLQLDYNFVLLVGSIALVNGIGIALAFTALTMLSVHNIPEGQHGLSNSMATTAFFFGGGLGLSIVSIFMSVTPLQNTIGEAPIIVVGLYGLGSLVWLSKDFLSARALLKSIGLR